MSGFVAWRNNNGAVYSVKQKSFLKNPNHKKGIPDICGFRKSDGVSIFVEIKVGRDKMSEDQLRFFDVAIKSGCVALVAGSFDEFEHHIKYFLR